MRHQSLLMEETSRPALAATPVPELHELLTVEEVAALLKVSKSWVYEHTRSRAVAPAERLPHVRIGKYVRFDERDLRAYMNAKRETWARTPGIRR